MIISAYKEQMLSCIVKQILYELVKEESLVKVNIFTN